MLAGVNEELRYSLLMLVVQTQCSYRWKLLLDGFSHVFQGVFQVLAGVNEERRYSLLIVVVQSQCDYSCQLCVDGLPQLF